MEIAAMVVLVGVTAAILLMPLLQGAPEPVPARAGTRARGGDMDETLADLEFDHATGKMSDEDYAAMRAEAEAEADAREAGTPPVAAVPAPDARDEVLDALEAEILAARRHRATQGRTAAPRFCTACGSALPASARFCPNCGNPVEGRP